MNKFFKTTTALLTLSALVACGEDSAMEESLNLSNGKMLESISITGKDFQTETGTRSTVQIDNAGVKFLWAENDTVGIFPNSGSQAEFIMAEGAGTQTATFNGGGWALKASSTYAAYYPYNINNRDLTKIPISYQGQTQEGNASTNHLGLYDFMATNMTTPSSGAIAFDMQHLGCLMCLDFNLEGETKIKLVSIKCNEETEVFTLDGYVDLTLDTPRLMATKTSNMIDVRVRDSIVTNEIATIYFMMSPVNLEGKNLECSIYDNDGSEKTFKVQGKNFVAGKAYRFVLSSENEISNENQVKRFPWFNPSQYINYKNNGEIKDTSGYRRYSSYITCPVTEISKIEYKFQMQKDYTNKIYLSSLNEYYSNYNSSISSCMYIDGSGLYIRGYRKSGYDEDSQSQYFQWSELELFPTEITVLTVSFKDKYLKINDAEYKLNVEQFKSAYLFSKYYYENGRYPHVIRGEGVPENSKLYYVKIWDENDNLIYIGGATTSLNPQTNEIENCWRSYYNGEYNYEFAYYKSSNYSPYGGGID